MGPVEFADDADDLARLIEDDRVDEVEELLRRKPELIARTNQYGVLPLHTAAESGNVRMVRLVIDHNARLDALSRGRTALAAAVWIEHEEVIRVLLEAGADPNAPTPDEMSLLAVPRTDLGDERAWTVFHALLEAGADIDLYLAVAFGQPTLVTALLRPDSEPARRRPYADLLLGIGCRLYPGTRIARLLDRRRQVISALLAYGFDPNRCVHWPPLYDAALADDAAVCRDLLTHGADPRAEVSGRPIAEWARAHGADRALAVLREHRAGLP